MQPKRQTYLVIETCLLNERGKIGRNNPNSLK